MKVWLIDTKKKTTIVTLSKVEPFGPIDITVSILTEAAQSAQEQGYRNVRLACDQYSDGCFDCFILGERDSTPEELQAEENKHRERKDEERKRLKQQIASLPPEEQVRLIDEIVGPSDQDQKKERLMWVGDLKK
jgi:hypothetical protein